MKSQKADDWKAERLSDLHARIQLYSDLLGALLEDLGALESLTGEDLESRFRWEESPFETQQHQINFVKFLFLRYPPPKGA